MTAMTDAVALYGTDDPVTPPRRLVAGPLTADLDAGNLRHIRVGAVEIIRAVSFIVRDPHWATYDPTITDLVIEERDGGFSVRYEAEVRDERQRFRYRARIEGRADRLSFAAEGEALTDFVTNRTGFVVLHPLDGVVGAKVGIEHVDGRTVAGRFPDLIDPVQPMMDLRALTHTAGGLTVTCRMEGDAFEMEDQRNWCDASYKTYVRPLSRPWPHTLAAGEPLAQSVTLKIEGAAPEAPSGDAPVRLDLGAPGGPAPPLGLGFDPDEFAPTRRVLARLAALRRDFLVCHYDPRRGHGRDALEAGLDVARALGAEPWLEAVIADVEGFEAEVAALGRLVESLGAPFRSVLLSPAPDLKSTTPGQAWPAAPPPEDFLRAARKTFPGVRLGGGMIASFTELNRKRPPLADIDVVSFTTMALIHAGDDHSVMEGLEALPSILRSARAIAGERPVAVGPSAIGLRLNPYGAAPVPNPENVRRAMVLNDPRHRGLLGAAWAVGYYAQAARAGAASVALGGTTGPFGVVHAAQDWPTPGFSADGVPYPMFHALQALARLGGAPLRAAETSAPNAVAAVAADTEGGTLLVLANLSADTRRVALPGVPARTRVLDAAAVRAGNGMMEAEPAATLTLPPYAVAEVLVAS